MYLRNWISNKRTLDAIRIRMSADLPGTFEADNFLTILVDLDLG